MTKQMMSTPDSVEGGVKVPVQPYIEAHPLYAGHNCNDCGLPLDRHWWSPVPRYEVRICPRDRTVVEALDGVSFYRKVV